MKRLFYLALAYAVAAAGPAASEDFVRLTESEITALFRGGMSYITAGGNSDLHFTYKDGGDWVVVKSAGGEENWGTWEISGAEICRAIKGPESYWGGLWKKPKCNPIYRQGNNLVWGKNHQRIELDDASVLARIISVDAPAAVATARQPIPKTAAAIPEIQDRPHQNAALERQKIKAEKRELELMRLALEKERLKQERHALQRQQEALQKQAPPRARPDNVPPVIDVVSALETTDDSLTIRGVARDNRKLTRIEIDGNEVAFRSRDGEFTINKSVNVGRNRIRISAFDGNGNKSEQIVTVTRRRNIPDIAYGDFHALIIGINDYDTLPKLKTAIADARAVAKTLETNYGYRVRLLENPSRDELVDALDEYRDALTEDDNLLIYYAGHGWLDKESNRGYWLPVGAKADRRSRWFSNASLTDALQALHAKHVMVVADSCYSGTLTRSLTVPPTRNVDYIARMAEKRTRVVLASGGLEPVLDSGGGKHSVFAAQFLKTLAENQGVLDGTQLFEDVRHKVVLNANQTPQYSDIRLAGHEGGDFLFVRKN